MSDVMVKDGCIRPISSMNGECYMEQALSQGLYENTAGTATGATSTNPTGGQQSNNVDQREGLFIEVKGGER